MVLCHFHTGELCFSRRSSPHISISLRKQVAWRSGSPRRVYVNTVGRPNDLSLCRRKIRCGVGRETLLSGRVVKAKRIEVLSARRISLFQYPQLAQFASDDVVPVAHALSSQASRSGRANIRRLSAIASAASAVLRSGPLGKG